MALAKWSPIKTLNWLYISTAVAVASLAIGGQILTQRSLRSQSEDAQTINLAGRQRMLSQKIAKAAYALASDNTPSIEERTIVEELGSALEQFEVAHRSLQTSSAELGLQNADSPEISALFTDIEGDYQILVEAAQSLLDTATSTRSIRSRQEAIASIRAGEKQFLPSMNAIVIQYEQEATAKIERLKRIQLSLLALTLLVLLPISVPLQQVSRRIKEMLLAMQKSGTEVASSSVQISASGRQLETMVTEQAAASAQITASSQEIAATANELSQNVEAIMHSATKTQQVAKGGVRDLVSMVAIINQLEQVTGAIATKLGTIEDRAAAIDRVVIAMTKVADQTNLLSLNAAIEAEKAGEYGAGFSVVAREIRRLADQTAVAALDIEQLVKEMQAAVSAGNAEMSRFSQQVNEGTENAKTITQQATAISEQIDALLPPLAAANQGIEAQSFSALQIRDAMEQLSTGTEQTVQALQETNIALDQLQGAAARLQTQQAAA